jgi:DNA polymerase III delta prime subunit
MQLRKILLLCFVCIAPGAFANGGSIESASKVVSEVLANYLEIFEFEDGDQFWGIDGATNRYQAILDRKKVTINDVLVTPIQNTIDAMVEADTLCTVPWTNIRISKKITQAISKAAVIPLLKYGAKAKMGHYDQVTGTEGKPLSDYLQSRNEDRYQRKQGDLVDIGFGVLEGVLDHCCSTDEKLVELNARIKNIEYALEHDKLAKLEKKIVEQLGGMHPSTRFEVVKAFMMMRQKPGIESAKYKDKIQHLFDYPRHTKPLPPGFVEGRDDYLNDEKTGEQDKFMEDIFSADGDSIFSHYSAVTKDRLYEIFMKICNRSREVVKREKLNKNYLPIQQPDAECLPLRCLFYGEHGTGKTHAAIQIAEELGLPYEYYKITKEGLSKNKQTGNSEYGVDGLGDLFKALFKKDIKGKNWKNPVLIIDDVHLMFSKDSYCTHAFLNELLDPNTKTLQCNYLGKDFEVDISGMTIILTGNSSFGEKTQRGETYVRRAAPRGFNDAKDVLAPIRDRLEMIHFDDFPLEQKRKILEKAIIANNMLGNSPANHRDLLEEQIAIRNSLLDFVIENFGYESIRKLRRLVESLALYKESDWVDKAGMNTFAHLSDQKRYEKIKDKLSDRRIKRSLNREIPNDMSAEDAIEMIIGFLNKFYVNETLDEVVNKAKIIVQNFSDGEEQWAVLCNIPSETIKLKELADLIRSNCDNKKDSITFWLYKYLKNSSFLDYYMKCRKVKAEYRVSVASDIADDIFDEFAPGTLVDKFREITVHDSNAWSGGDYYEEDDSDDDDGRPGPSEPNDSVLNPAEDLSGVQLKFFNDLEL